MQDAGHRRAGPGSAALVPALVPALVLALVLTACGDGQDAGPGAPPGLDALQALEDPGALDAALAAWPVSRVRADDEDLARRVLTWRLRRHAAAHRIEAAAADLEVLRAQFDGTGRTLEGVALGEDLLAAGLTEAALAAARSRMEGAEPDRAGAGRALALATALDDGELASAVEGTRRWCEAERLEDLGLDLPAPATRGPRVVLLADAFALGPTSTLPPQWARWRRDDPDAHLELVPLTRGFVMAGIRRVPTPDPADEVRAIQDAVAAAAPTVHAAVAGRDLEEALALGGSDSAVVVLDAEGRIVARASGAHLDLQRLEGAWQRLARSGARGPAGN